MVIGDYLGYSSLGYGVLRTRTNPTESAVTLEGKLDPQKPNQYSVQVPPRLIIPPEKASDAQNTGKSAPKNTDPVSRIFNAVADSGSMSMRKPVIDIFI